MEFLGKFESDQLLGGNPGSPPRTHLFHGLSWWGGSD